MQRDVMNYDVLIVALALRACLPQSASSSWLPHKNVKSASACWKKALKLARISSLAPS